MAHAADTVATAIRAPSEEVCLLGNATDACMAVALRWAKLLAAERRQKGAAQSSKLTSKTISDITFKIISK